MNTLEKKKLLTREKVGLVNFYTPTCTRDAAVKAEMTSLLSRAFDGSIPALANSLLSLDDLSLSELDKIKQLLDRREKELKDESS
jgi:predicted transcriptional regulator